MSLFARKPKRAPKPAAGAAAGEVKGRKTRRSDEGYEKERLRSAAISAAKSLAGRDIAAGMPPVQKPARKARARESFEYFCREYYPEVFALPWSQDHRRAIERIEQVVRSGGLFAYAMPRGNGKTSMAEKAVEWAVLYGFRQFPVLIGSDEEAALGLLDTIKTDLETNDLLFEDFPEVCYPIRRLEGIAHRANGQLFGGARTHIVWTAQQIVLPTVPGSAASGAIIATTGITGRIRGMKFARPGDGRNVRPDLVIPDDPQTDESARSPTQCRVRVKILCGAVLGLAGPGKKISGILPCTVIEPGDMADELLDRQRHPEWQGERTKLIYKWPACTLPEHRQEGGRDLWEEYKKVRGDSLRAGNEGREATAFYKANREAMDAGAEVAWPSRHNPDELSALQHAMNLRADLGDAAFFAEYQNDPPREQAEASEYLTAAQIAEKVNGRRRGQVPREATKLVAFIDVQKAALPWVVCAFEDDFTGYLVDYGFFPDQNREYFSLRDVRRTLAFVLKTKGLEETIYQGLSRLTDQLLGREWKRDDKDGTAVRIDRCLVDANWGESTDVVYQFCRQSAHAAVLVPTHGQYVGATSRPFRNYKAKPGDEVGDHWRRPIPANRRGIRYGLYDTNHYKTFFAQRLAVPIGGRGCFSLFGDDPAVHRLIADHWTSENPTPVTAKGITVTEWSIKPSRPDNHLLDGVVGCHVAASMLRVALAERRQQAAGKRRRVKLSEIQARKGMRQQG